MTTPRAIVEWIVSVAAPAALRKAGCPDEADILEALGPGMLAVATARAVSAKVTSEKDIEVARIRLRVAAVVRAAVELYDLAPTVAFQDPLVKQAEALAREIGALAGMMWSEGGAA